MKEYTFKSSNSKKMPLKNTQNSNEETLESDPLQIKDDAVSIAVTGTTAASDVNYYLDEVKQEDNKNPGDKTLNSNPYTHFKVEGLYGCSKSEALTESDSTELNSGVKDKLKIKEIKCLAKDNPTISNINKDKFYPNKHDKTEDSENVALSTSEILDFSQGVDSDTGQ